MPFFFASADPWFRAEVFAWIVAGSWVYRVADAHFGMPRVADLTMPEYDRAPASAPLVRVVVPALNEQEAAGACLRSLAAQDYPRVQVIAVDDRSTDRTGEVMDRCAAEAPGRIAVLHLRELPAGWLGKPHAMAEAAAWAGEAEVEQPEWLLFTDADVLFRTDVLRRVLAFAESSGTDHLVLNPTTIIKRWDEAALLSFIGVFGLWGLRPWRVPDPRSRDAIGIGAFNLIRRKVYEQIGGFAALRMAVVEDLALAGRVKRAGFRQRMVFGPGMVRVHWASGALGLIRTLTKNIFAVFRYRAEILLAACVWLAFFAIAPFGLVWIPALRWPCAVTIAAIAYGYVLMNRPAQLSPANVALAPFAAAAFIYAMLRSLWFTLRQGGIVWRGTFYPLAELRRNQPAR